MSEKFDFEEALKALKSGQAITGKDGVLAPLIKQLTEAALEGEIENAAWQYQNADWQSQNDNSVDEWLELLIAPGSSIGGARPKAGIRDEQENLWIAKFPGRNDEYDVGLWELLVSTLAKESGLDVAEARAEKFGLSHHTYLVKRFDRVVDEGNRRRKPVSYTHLTLPTICSV